MKNILDPSGNTKDIPETSFENLIEGTLGWIDIGLLMFLVPKGTPNTWIANPTDRIQNGFKYEWKDTTQRRYVVHGHEVDSQAPEGSVARNNWIVRIRHGDRYLLSETVNPPTGGPTNWSSNETYSNLSHIPAIRERVDLL